MIQINQQNEKKFIAGLFFLAFLVRLLYFADAVKQPFFYSPILDEKYYIDQGLLIANGDWLGDTLRFYMDPLYSYILGLVFFINDNLMWVRLLQMLGDASTVIPLFLIGLRLFSSHVGLLAGLLYAFYLPAIFLSPILFKASILTALLTWYMYYFIVVLAKENAMMWLSLGILCALLVYLRSNIFILVPLILLSVSFLVERNRSLKILLFLVGLGLIFSVGMARNYKVLDEFQIFGSTAGYVFYGSNTTSNRTGIHGQPDFVKENHPVKMDTFYRQEAKRRTGQSMNTNEASDYWMTIAIEEIKDNPSNFIRLMAKRLKLLLANFEFHYQYFIEDAEEASWLFLLPLPEFGIIMAFGMVGLFVACPHRRESVVLLFPICIVTVTCLLFFVAARLRLPMVPMLMLGASFLLFHILDLSRQRSFKRILLLSIPVVLLLIFSHLNNEQPDFTEIRLYNKALAYHNQKNFEASEVVLDQLLMVNEQHEKARVMLGRLKMYTGHLNEAILIYEELLQDSPENDKLWYQLGELWLQKDDIFRARQCFQNAYEIDSLPEYEAKLNKL